ncbi:outer membrane beta-barrel protein [Elizabethkingia argentiflava]|uniref:Outer membrane beta-barrel protein n=1 Tax=Elizabethkingia argenteiflava TaxID=2681556 RepID=A0A845PW53_9FLAO|nr:porin family protein [Elizabethkingia argenteiflava]NAW51096.1 outer membrane beta-barrel protein [Elizabethkingia argenteiflava]
MNKRIILLIAVVLWKLSYTQSYNDLHTSLKKSDSILDQQLLNNEVKWGIKAGWTYSNLYGKDLDDIFASNKTEFKNGFQAGIYVDTRISKKFGLIHELLFSQKRIGVMLADTQYGDYTSNLSLFYLDLMPANLNFYIGRFQLYTGAYLSALLNASVQRKDKNARMFKDKSIFGDPKNDESQTRYLQKFDFGVNVGVEYGFDFGLSIGARYMHGFTDIFQYANTYTNGEIKTDNIKIYNRGYMLSLGYAFGSNKRQ